MTDLNDHPFAVFMAGESYESPTEKAWLAWCRKVEKILGHSLDGDQARDGYSLDFAHDEFCNGLTPAEYVAEIRQRQGSK
jgi:hypothetical protein